MTVILIEHSSDAGSAAVRAASLEAATTLLGAKQSHGVMRALLPSLGNLIHDRTEKVRLAVVRMLLRIKQIPGIRYYHVVPADQLSARLVEEAMIHRSPKNIVSKELTGLMLNSYFPQGENVSGTNQLQRTITYLLTDPNAAHVFYANLPDHLEVHSVVKLIRTLQSCMKSAIETDQAREVNQSQKEKKRRRPPSWGDATVASLDDDDDVTGDRKNVIEKLSASNTSLMASLAETINILWDSILRRLEEPSSISCKNDLEAHFSSVEIKACIAHFELKGLECCSSSNNSNNKNASTEEVECKRNECFRVCSSLLSCATRHGAKSRKDVASFIGSSLTSLAKGNCTDVVPLITSYLAFLATSNHVLEVSTSLAKSVEQSLGEEISLFSPTLDESLGMRRTSRRSIMKKDDGIVPPFPTAIAWGVLENILQGVGSDGLALRNAIVSSNSAKLCLENSLKNGIRFAERILGLDLLGRNFPLDDVESVLHAIDAHGRFCLHKESTGLSEGDGDTNDDGNLSPDISSFIEWTTENVIPALVGSCEIGTSNLRNLDVSYISNVNESMIQVAPPGSPSISSPPKQKANQGRTPLAMRTSTSSVLDRGQHGPPIDFAIQFASTLIQYACLLCTEMLAIGKVSPSLISKSAVKWSQVLRQEEIPLSKQLVASFARLSNQLCRTSGNFDLLEELLVQQIDLLDVTTFGIDLKRVLKSTLKNASPPIIDNIVKAYLNTVDRLIGLLQIPSEFTLATMSDEVPGTQCTDILLQAIVGHPTANISLCNALVAKLSESEGEITKRDTALSMCLSFVARNSNTAREVARIIRADLDPYKFDEDGGMREILEKVLAV
jgi:condensin-2 complex subunit G2